MKRVLIYSHDTFGLGNIRRMLEIARHLVASSSQVSVLILTGSPMLHAFRVPQRIDYVKLPCLARDVEGRYAPRLPDFSLHDTVRMRANIIRGTIAGFDPHLVLVDKKPFGVENELSGALADLPQPARRPKWVLLLRDILDSPQATIPVWRRHGYFEAIDAYYDQVLVVGSSDIYDLPREYAFPALTSAKVRFCGYIAREHGRVSREATRAQLGVARTEPLLLVTPGGGQDGHALIDATLQALLALPAQTCPRTHIVCGPELQAAARQQFEQVALRQPRVSMQEFSDDMMSLMDAADVVVAMGGYNTVCELMALHKRVIVVPRVRPVREQLIRAECMAARGLLRLLHPDQLTPQALWDVLRAELAAWRERKPLPRLTSMNGLAKTTGALLEHLALESTLPAIAALPRVRANHFVSPPLA